MKKKLLLALTVLSLVLAFGMFTAEEADAGFFAGATADCGGGNSVSCTSEPGSCSATDGVGCACTHNGAITALVSCREVDQNEQ